MVDRVSLSGEIAQHNTTQITLMNSLTRRNRQDKTVRRARAHVTVLTRQQGTRGRGSNSKDDAHGKHTHKMDGDDGDGN